MERSGGRPAQVDAAPHRGEPDPRGSAPCRISRRRHQLPQSRRHLQRFHPSLDLKLPGARRQAPVQIDPVEQVAGASPPHCGPHHAAGVGSTGLQIETHLAQVDPGLGLKIVHQQRGIFHGRGDQAGGRAFPPQASEIPGASRPAHRMHSRPAQMDGGDRGRTGGQISQRRAAGQSHLVNPNHLPPLLGHIGIDQRNSPQHDPLAAHQAGPLHPGHQRWEFLSQPGLRATAHLFPHPVATEKSGRQNAHDRTGHCPAHDRPKRSGKRVHRRNSPDGMLRAAETSIRSGCRCGGQAPGQYAACRSGTRFIPPAKNSRKSPVFPRPPSLL